MIAEPQIVSLWSDATPCTDNYLCVGLRLDPRHILTVRHALADRPERAPTFVRLIRNHDQSKRAYLLHRHDTLDAAILALDVPVGDVPFPPLRRTGSAPTGSRVLLRVVDPKIFNAHPLESHTIGSYDEEHDEYILSPRNAIGHSGGLVEVGGAIVGLLSRRAKDDPLCRAVAVHRLWPWLEARLSSEPAVLPSPSAPLPEPQVISAAYRHLVERVRKNVREILQKPEAELLRRNWSDDPVARFDPKRPTEQLIEQADALFLATKKTIALWQARPVEPLADARADRKGLCETLVTELVKLAVHPGLEYEIDALAGSPPARLKMASRYAFSGEIAYFALGDLLQQLRLRSDCGDITGAQSLYFISDIAGGQGEDLYQELLRKLWVLVMERPDHGYLSVQEEQVLMGRIENHARRDRRRYLVVMPPGERTLPALLDRQWKGSVKPGILEHEPGECRYLLTQEQTLFTLLLDYLELLERL